MTALIGGSLLLIVGSALALVFGWAGADPTLIWTSIAAAVGAAICLALAYYRSMQETARSTRSTRRPQPAGETSTEASRVEDSTQATPAVGSADPGAGAVIAYPDRARYHRPDCRFAQVRGGERMTKGAAERRGYDACRVCNP